MRVVSLFSAGVARQRYARSGRVPCTDPNPRIPVQGKNSRLRADRKPR